MTRNELEAPKGEPLRVVGVAIGGWAALAIGVRFTPLLDGLGTRDHVLLAVAMAALAVGIHGVDAELRSAARRTPRGSLLAAAIAFDALAVATLVVPGLFALGPLFAWPLAAAFHLAALEGAAAPVRRSVPARSPARSPAGT